MQRWSLLSSARLAAPLLALGMALEACGVTHHIAVDDLSLPAMAVTPLPITMGLYYPPELRTARNQVTVGDDTYEFAIGPGTVAGFDAAAAAMFDEVVPVQQLPGPGAESGALAGILEVNEARGTDAPIIEVSYYIVLHGADGAKRAGWSVVGNAASDYSFRTSNLVAAARAAMRDAIAVWMVGFATQKDVKPWLEAIGVAPPAAAATPEEGS